MRMVFLFLVTFGKLEYGILKCFQIKFTQVDGDVDAVVNVLCCHKSKGVKWVVYPCNLLGLHFVVTVAFVLCF